MQFCRECANMLYPLEEDDRLLYVCRTCPHKELADEHRVFHNVVQADEVNEAVDVQVRCASRCPLVRALTRQGSPKT